MPSYCVLCVRFVSERTRARQRVSERRRRWLPHHVECSMANAFGDVQTTITQNDFVHEHDWHIREQADKRNWMVWRIFHTCAARRMYGENISQRFIWTGWSSIHVRSTFSLAYVRMISYSDWLRCCCRDNYSLLHHIQMPLMPWRVCGYFHYRNDSDIRQTLGVQCDFSVVVFP